MILVDTSVWIDYFNGRKNEKSDQLDLLLLNEVIIIGDLIYCEILQGFRNDSQFKIVNAYLSNFMHVELGGFPVAFAAAKNLRLLRKKGITIRKTLDMIIGTWCIMNKCPLLHNDNDFLALEKYSGLKSI